jgi:aminobenzoyl-glutamate utilization protein B
MFAGAPAHAENKAKGMKMEAFRWIDENRAEFEQAAKEIHGFAETGMQEYQSSSCLADMLERHGFSVERGVAGMPTAFVATFGSGSPVIGFLGEYDALPGLSQKPFLPYKEECAPGAPGHGCGHNLFGTGSVAAVLGIKAAMEKYKLPGTVKYFGCPAEETSIGKVYMARDGIFNGLDACFTWHPGSKTMVNIGSTNALNNFEVIFRGKTSHAAADPYKGRSALDAVELMDVGVNFLREHVKESVRIHYVIKEGGQAPNIVPDYARVWYFVRDINRQGVDEVYERVLNCAKGASIMTDTTMEVNLITGIYNYLPNIALSSVVQKNLKETGVPQFTPEEEVFAREMQKTLGIPQDSISAVIEKFEKPETVSRASTDVSDVSWIVPTAGELSVAASPAGVPSHSWAIVSSSGSSVGVKGMIVAAKVLAASGIDILTDKAVVEQARREFIESTKGCTYRSTLPAGQKPPIPKGR